MLQKWRRRKDDIEEESVGDGFLSGYLLVGIDWKHFSFVFLCKLIFFVHFVNIDTYM